MNDLCPQQLLYLHLWLVRERTKKRNGTWHTWIKPGKLFLDFDVSIEAHRVQFKCAIRFAHQNSANGNSWKFRLIHYYLWKLWVVITFATINCPLPFHCIISNRLWPWWYNNDRLNYAELFPTGWANFHFHRAHRMHIHQLMHVCLIM